MRTAKKDQDRGVRGLPRRSLLRVALAVAAAVPLAGCDLSDDEPAPEPSPDPLATLVTGALDLAAQYEAAVAAFPELAEQLNPIAQAHQTHAAELAQAIGVVLPSDAAGSPSPTGTPPGPAATEGGVKAALAALRVAEKQGHEAATEACLTTGAKHAALVGSIAAARATHLEVLR